MKKCTMGLFSKIITFLVFMIFCSSDEALLLHSFPLSTVIQTIIEALPNYQDGIESWGYQVSVLPRFTQESDEEGLLRYYWESAGPVPVLIDPEGGRYCFYYGFDQYMEEFVKPGTLQVLHSQKEMADARRTVRLQIYKRDMDRHGRF